MASVSTERKYNINSKKTATRSVQTEVVTTPAYRTPVNTEAQYAAKTEPIATKNIKSKNKSFPFVLITGALLCTAMVMLMVFNFARQYELNVEVSRQTKELSKLDQELRSVDEKIERELAAQNLEKYSVEVLGYVPKEQLECRVIESERKDVITVAKTENKQSGFEVLLSSLYDTIKSLFE